MAPPVDTDTKEALRARFRAYRSRLAPDAVAAKSAAIRQRVRALPEVQQARTLHAYWPMVDHGEIDTRPLIRSLHDHGVQVVLPVVAKYGKDTPALEHRRYAGPDALRANRWDIQEPVDTASVPPDALDVVLVPAFGAGRNGHRIGHGYGYYDAFLSALDVPTIALVYDDCLIEAIPADAHDVPVSIIVTDRRTVRPPADA